MGDPESSCSPWDRSHPAHSALLQSVHGHWQEWGPPAPATGKMCHCCVLLGEPSGADSLSSPPFSPTRARCSSAHPGLQHLEEPWHSRCPCHCADTPRHVNAFLSCRKSPARSQRLEKKTAAWTGAVCIPFCCWEGRKEPTQSPLWCGAPLSSPSLITKEVPWSKGLEAHGAHHPLGNFTFFSSPKAQLKHYLWRQQVQYHQETGHHC